MLNHLSCSKPQAKYRRLQLFILKRETGEEEEEEEPL